MAGGWGGGGQGPPGAPQGGLPFGGIPSEMVPRVERLLASEPEHPEESVVFSHVTPETQPFTLWRLLKPRWPVLLVGILLVTVESVTLQGGPLFTRWAIDKGVIARNTGWVVAMGLLYLAATLVNTVVSRYRTSLTGHLGQALMKDLRVRVFSHIQRLSLDFFTGEKAGRIMTRMTSDIEALSDLLQDGIINLAVQLTTLLFLIGVLFWMNVRLALLITVVIVPIMTVMTLWFRNASERTYGNVRDRIADLLADLQENLSGIRIITAFNRQRFNLVKHRNLIGAHYDANVDTARVAAIYGPGTDFVGAVGQAAVVLVGGWMLFDGQVSPGELIAFVLFITQFFAPIQQLVQLYNTYQSGQAAIAKLADLLSTRPSVEEKADAYALPPIDGEIRLENVTFGYDPDRPVLRDVDLTIAPGETFALVGQTGAGKSTIAKLVTRFYDPTAGRVFVDGHDLRDVTLTSLRRQLGVVPQEPFLFGGSIRDNIGYARPDASDEEIDAACRKVGLGELIDRLPDGIHTPVFERGSSLSSGERQLLALARAFMAEPRVLVLDEATSSLDLRSEAIIERALDVVLEGRTAILIAHRLSTAMRADRIAVVDDGGIVELGSHAELLAQHGRYAAMFATWLSHMNEPAAS
ncbi:MAG TPA: ABC transporter ATP-binding protein [Acidimicrobiales bacterium]|nr:ABC transporter ATP-binding protein [Acidimicrobiales bacterium]